MKFIMSGHEYQASDWYHLRMEIPIPGNLKSNEFAVIVNRQHVESVRDMVVPGDFEKNFQEDVERFRPNAPVPEMFMIDLLKGKLPWLQGIEIGSCALCLSDSAPSSLDYDPKTQVLYFTHNCDTFGQRGVLLSAFGVWAYGIERLHIGRTFQR